MLFDHSKRGSWKIKSGRSPSNALLVCLKIIKVTLSVTPLAYGAANLEWGEHYIINSAFSIHECTLRSIKGALPPLGFHSNMQHREGNRKRGDSGFPGVSEML